VLRFWNYDEATLRADANVLATLNNRSVEVCGSRAPLPLRGLSRGLHAVHVVLRPIPCRTTWVGPST
jgi:hypothetical protein